MKIDLSTAAKRLQHAEDILILSHRRPDGDTTGTAYGLYYALKQMGKRVRIECADSFSEKFSYFYEEPLPAFFEPQFIVSVDTASRELLGRLKEVYGDSVDLAIDHHKSNEFYAKETYLDYHAPATAQIMYRLIEEMGATLEPIMADALFTGIVTDTGGLRFESVTSETYRVMAELVDGGARHGYINQMIFENVSRGRMEVEAIAIRSLEYYFDGTCALLYLPNHIKEEYQIEEEELEGLASMPRTIKGVMVSVTLQDLEPGSYRVSIRSNNPYDASRIGSHFGGGGHANAAGCTVYGTLEQVKEDLLQIVEQELKQENQ